MSLKNFIPVSAGIDVSKEKLDVALLNKDGEIMHFIVSNDESGIRKIIRKLKNFRGKIVMESTGRYHLLSALRLSESDLDIRVVNPLSARKYMQCSIRKNKTDKVDAIKLAEMAVLEKNLPKTFCENNQSIIIRQKIGLISSLEKQIQTLRAIMNNFNHFRDELNTIQSDGEADVQASVNSLKRAKNKLEKEIEDLILRHAEKSESRDILCSIPGISQYVSALMLQFFHTDYNRSNKQWIAYIGMDVSVKQSGKWRGRGRLSKRGNAYMRKRMFSAAWGAVMNNASFRSYYDDLKSNGRKHAEALVIIARKLIRIAYVLLNNNQHYNDTLCFSKP